MPSRQAMVLFAFLAIAVGAATTLWAQQNGVGSPDEFRTIGSTPAGSPKDIALSWDQGPQDIAIRAGMLFDSNTGQMLPNQIILIHRDRVPVVAVPDSAQLIDANVTNPGLSVKTVVRPEASSRVRPAEHEQITDVGPADRVKIPTGAQVIDLSHATVVPGLMDMHTHMFAVRLDDGHQDDRIHSTFVRQTLIAAADVRAELMAGITAAREAESHGTGAGDVDVRNAIDYGEIPGPRYQVTTVAIGASGRLGSWEFPVDIYPPGSFDDPVGAIEIRKAVRERVRYGAEWIKVYNQGAGGKGSYTLEEMRALVDEAHRRDAHVLVHVMNGQALEDTIEALGVGDSIEHGVGLTPELAKKMKDKGEYLDATIWRYHDEALFLRREAQRKNDPTPEAEKFIRMALASGVKILCGSGVDSDWHGPYAFGDNLRELEFLVKYGMPPAQAIQSASKVDAEILGWQDHIGSIEKGKYADIIAVSGNPLQDITELERVKFVMKGAVVYRNDFK